MDFERYSTQVRMPLHSRTARLGPAEDAGRRHGRVDTGMRPAARRGGWARIIKKRPIRRAPPSPDHLHKDLTNNNITGDWMDAGTVLSTKVEARPNVACRRCNALPSLLSARNCVAFWNGSEVLRLLRFRGSSAAIGIAASNGAGLGCNSQAFGSEPKKIARQSVRGEGSAGGCT